MTRREFLKNLPLMILAAVFGVWILKLWDFKIPQPKSALGMPVVHTIQAVWSPEDLSLLAIEISKEIDKEIIDSLIESKAYL